YLAMVHRRPVILLGRTHLYAKGCAYEIGSRHQLREIMESALKEGFTTERQRQWLKHVAQLLKYYLYPIDETMAQIIGKNVDKVVQYIIKQMKSQTDSKIGNMTGNPVQPIIPPLHLLHREGGSVI
ncbi:MAG: hypothetical protein GY940_34710, partial [bacterium]|nr:hypothetical protein [bacterium]